MLKSLLHSAKVEPRTVKGNLMTLFKNNKI